MAFLFFSGVSGLSPSRASARERRGLELERPGVVGVDGDDNGQRDQRDPEDVMLSHEALSFEVNGSNEGQ
jgi:hypothetical protein